MILVSVSPTRRTRLERVSSSPKKAGLDVSARIVCRGSSPAIASPRQVWIHALRDVLLVVDGPHLVLEALVDVDLLGAGRRSRSGSLRCRRPLRALDMMRGAPEQFTLMPTTSLGETKRAHASSIVFRVSGERAHSGRQHPARRRLGRLCRIAASIEASEWTRTTCPRYGPGMPGLGDAGKRLTTLYTGSEAGAPRRGRLQRREERSACPRA